MQIEIDNFKIENRHLTGVIFNYDKDIYFQGRALDDEGKRICDRLSKFKMGSTVEIKAESDYHTRQGVYEIYEILIPAREEKDRAIYRFSCKLRPVY